MKIAKNFDFEYGFGFGIGVVFGDLYDDWVRVANKGDSFTLGGQPGTRRPATAPARSPGSQTTITFRAP